MVKIALVVMIAIVAVAYTNDPNAFKSWGEVIDHASVAVAKVAKATGEAANQLIRDEAHKDSVVEKAKDVASDAGNSAKQAVTGK